MSEDCRADEIQKIPSMSEDCNVAKSEDTFIVNTL